MTIQQVAALEGVSGAAVRYWIWEGWLPAERSPIPGYRKQYWRYSISHREYARFAQRRRAQSRKLTVTEVARLQGVSHSTAWRWVKDGRLQASSLSIVGDTKPIIRIDPAEYYRFIQCQKESNR